MREILREILSCKTKCNPEVADLLIEKFGTIYEIAEASPETISDAINKDMQTSVYIKLALSLASRRITDMYKLGKIYTGGEIERYLCSLFFTTTVETVYVLSFDSQKRLLGVDYAGEGTLNFLSIMPRRLLEVALKRKAVSVIIAHNHPGGYAQPSEDDRAATRCVKEVLGTSGVELFAHYVVCASEITKIEID